MPTPVWMLLAFAAWTVVLLTATVGLYRWSQILGGRVPINGFTASPAEGADWYRRAMRAHANCLENLPVFASIVLALHVTQLDSTTVTCLSIAITVARVLQSLVHVVLTQTPLVATFRFAFFFAQVVCFLSLVSLIVAHAT